MLTLNDYEDIDKMHFCIMIWPEAYGGQGGEYGALNVKCLHRLMCLNKGLQMVSMFEKDWEV